MRAEIFPAINVAHSFSQPPQIAKDYYKTKATLGAKPDPMSVGLRHRVPAMNRKIRAMLGAATHDEAPERNPFKTTGSA